MGFSGTSTARGTAGSVLAAAAAFACLLVPAQAGAGTINMERYPYSGYRFSYNDGLDPALSGLRLDNASRIEVAGNSAGTALTTRDLGQLVLPGASVLQVLLRCQISLDRATCSGAPGAPFNAAYDLAGGADSISVNEHPAISVSAIGGGGIDVMRGGAGSESFDGGPGDDEVWGGPGDDLLEYPMASYYTTPHVPGADTIHPGPGQDRVGAIDDGDSVDAADGERDVIRCDGSNAHILADPVDELLSCPNAEIL